MAFSPRTTAPSTTNKYYKHTSAGGVNECILIGNGSVLPNCVGYAWGRFYEISGKRPKLSCGNAENWYRNTSDGYKRGQTPKLGAVVCWAKGKVGVSGDGAGHVAVVEKIYSDGSILVSQSGYRSLRFWTSKIKKGYKLSGYTFLGFIYNPAVSASNPAPAKTTFKAGKNYKLQANMKVRKGAGTSYAQKRRSELTADGQKHSLNQTMAVLKKGTVITCTAVSGNWVKCPSGWICGKQNDVIYLK